jgi:hypothetical protein
MRHETYEFNRALILSVLVCIEAWEKWIGYLSIGAVKTLNLSLIRLVKGLVKAWRLYLSEWWQSNNQQVHVGSQHSAASSVNINGGD